MEEFYGSFALRARDLAEKADPFTKRRLLDLAKQYDLKGSGPSYPQRLVPAPCHRLRCGIRRLVRPRQTDLF